MKIAYGVHGYSRGHATRALSMLQELRKRHEVLVFAGGDAFDLLQDEFAVERIPCLGFSYRRGRRSTWHTLCDNAPRFIDLARHGRSVQLVSEQLTRFQPHAVISDAEPWLHRAAQRLRIPRIAFDHFGILVHCRVALPVHDWFRSLIDRVMYLALTRSPERVLVSSFFHAAPRNTHVQVIGPILREQVRSTAATAGQHLLAYFNQGKRQLSPQVLEALHGTGREVRVYGGASSGRHGNLQFRPAGLQPFLSDLASCKAVVCTAGNQLVGEAMQLRKPIYALPEATVEQRLNARQIAALGIGEYSELPDLSSEKLLGFLSRCAEYRCAAERHARDGQQQALELLERWLHELHVGPTLHATSALPAAPASRVASA